MYKLLIADDEVLIREGLKTIIDWESEGFSLMGTAANGNQCNQMILSKKPELCIIDIQMPGMTGLEVIENCRKERIPTNFIILSGHSEFEYAQKAIKYGVQAYLLKPIEEEDLIGELRKIRKDLENKRLIEEDDSLRTRDYFRFCTGLEEKYNFQEKPEAALNDDFQLMMIKASPAKADLLNNFMRENDLGLVLNSSTPFIFIMTRCFRRQESLNELNEILSDFGKKSSLVIDGCISPVFNEAEEAAKYLSILQEDWKIRFFADRNGIICHSDIPEINTEIKTPLKEQETRSEIEKLIEIGMNKDLIRELRQISISLIGSGLSPEQVRDKLSRIALASLEAVISRQKLRDISSDEYSQTMLILQQCHRLNEFIESIEKQLNEIINKRDFQTNKRLVKRMIFLIESHYMENLKIKDLSKILYYNSAYLGKVFKAEAGVSFNVYLDKTRIEMAKKFLAEGYKVYQVSEKVGYSYVDYFHAKFKKYVGKSPLEYRNDKLNKDSSEDD